MFQKHQSLGFDLITEEVQWNKPGKVILKSTKSISASFRLR